MKSLASTILMLCLLSSCLEGASNTRSPINGGSGDGDSGGDLGEAGADRVTTCTTNCSDSTDLLASGLYREAGSNQMTLGSEQVYAGKDSYPSGYYDMVEELPEVKVINNTDADSGSDENPSLTECGTSEDLNNFAAMKNSCANKNEDTYRWGAADSGIAGEADWELAYNKDEKAIWQDMRTELVWSYVLDTQVWDLASGIEFSDETEQTTYCDEAFSEVTFKKIKWRLPTREEFLQADIDGARFVLDGIDDVFWTATPGEESDESWGIKQKNSILKSYDRTIYLAVRCVGVVVD